MMKRTCVQCGKEFEISQSEIAFFRKKKLSLPKRCKECRELNKKKKSSKKNQDDNRQQNDIQQSREQMQQPVSTQGSDSRKKKKMGGKQRLAYIAAAVLLGFGGGGAALSSMNEAEPVQPTAIEQTVEMQETANYDMEGVVVEENVQDENDQKVEIAYEFRNEELWESHYKKHGIEMGFESKEAYLEGANRVIASPNVLQKTEEEDGDFVYYLEETNEFVVVAKKGGYLRTYFNPSDGINYYNRQ